MVAAFITVTRWNKKNLVITATKYTRGLIYGSQSVILVSGFNYFSVLFLLVCVKELHSVESGTAKQISSEPLDTKRRK